MQSRGRTGIDFAPPAPFRQLPSPTENGSGRRSAARKFSDIRAPGQHKNRALMQTSVTTKFFSLPVSKTASYAIPKEHENAQNVR